MKVIDKKPHYKRGVLARVVGLVTVMLIGLTERNELIHYLITLITLLMGFGYGYYYRDTEKKK